ncbi:hypothetical protein [Ekhidna sp.]|uniref:hypothetical protein n=1 Tax=Ekhidna sp. TaxID=2608089 RepID=UPI003C7C6225
MTELSLNSQTSVSRIRTYFMRGLFALNFLSLFTDNWSQILFPTEQMDTLTGVTISFWAAFSLLNLIGIRFPIKMVPILLIQFLYKLAWLIGIYRPAYLNDSVDENIQSFFWICIAGVGLNLLIIPWKYVYQEYIKNFFKLKKAA